MGLAHIYNRAFQATNAAPLADAARLWADTALRAYRKPGSGVGGFLAWLPEKSPFDFVGTHTGFLMGAAGIALALLALVAPVTPRWDAVLLTEIP
jgi:hypothetical protein